MFKLLLSVIIFSSSIDGYVTVNVLPAFLSPFDTFYKKEPTFMDRALLSFFDVFQKKEPTFMDRALLSFFDVFQKKEPTFMDHACDMIYFALAAFMDTYSYV